ncbi:MAG: UvrD/REP helicase, partial [Acidimicrobiaceae bacterium]|nr:UvrD/REP helicase [Acidimicrobiaceae bacterium]
QAGGRWRLDAPPPAGLAEHQVGQALGALHRLAERRHELSLSGLVEEVIADRRLLQLAAGQARRADVWRRTAFVVSQARAFAEAGGQDLAGFLRWADRQALGAARVVEPPPGEEDEDAVVVLTVHAAKGLEFPVVALAELGSRPRGIAGPTLLRAPDGTPEVRLRVGLSTSGFERLASDDREAGRREELRLCYVAATRARDHLLVSLLHEPSASAAAASLAQVVWGACRDLDSWCLLRPAEDRQIGSTGIEIPEAQIAETQLSGPGPYEQLRIDLVAPEEPHLQDGGPAGSLAGYEAWKARRERLLARLAVPVSLAPSELVAEPAWQEARRGSRRTTPEDDETSPRRAATAVGRAVHGVLQRVDLASGAEIAGLAAALARREGCVERAGEVAALASSALLAPVVQAAAQAKTVRRELPLAVPIAGGVVDGVIDLCFLDDDELVVVDYKTDALDSPADADAAAARYRLQVGAYVLALEAALGRRVDRCVLVFLAPPQGAVEREIGDLEALAEAARAALAERFAKP